MRPYPFALRFVMLVFAEWVSQRQQEAIEYLLMRSSFVCALLARLPGVRQGPERKITLYYDG